MVFRTVLTKNALQKEKESQGDEESYNPYAHRHLDHPNTWVLSIIHENSKQTSIFEVFFWNCFISISAALIVLHESNNSCRGMLNCQLNCYSFIISLSLRWHKSIGHISKVILNENYGNFSLLYENVTFCFCNSLQIIDYFNMRNEWWWLQTIFKVLDEKQTFLPRNISYKWKLELIILS